LPSGTSARTNSADIEPRLADRVWLPGGASCGAEEAAQAVFQATEIQAIDVWLYQYMIVMARYSRWSGIGWNRIAGSAGRCREFADPVHHLVPVQLSVLLNNWFGTFYDLIQKALSAPNTVTLDAYFAQLATVLYILMTSIIVAVVNFSWSSTSFSAGGRHERLLRRQLDKLRRIEGASQRIRKIRCALPAPWRISARALSSR